MKGILSIVFLSLLIVQDNFTFTNENQKVILSIDNNAKTLTWEKNSIIKLRVENIDTKKMTMSAKGIMFMKSDKPTEEVNLSITPKRESFQNDTLNLHIGFKNEKNEFIHHKFLILITK
ncbi:hypothetical protein WFZ85_15895 [Flavobacterium sp. j3]|uniref:Uncharacterized protein n=1 Tax=Flavobacterium aureirubrum TaxID=3133147 RepID=A0ABU9NBQ1_9FLAO